MCCQGVYVWFGLVGLSFKFFVPIFLGMLVVVGGGGGCVAQPTFPSTDMRSFVLIQIYRRLSRQKKARKRKIAGIS